MRVALLALLLIVAGCSGGDSGNAGVNLRMTVWTSEKTQLALFDEIANEYKKDHPNVTSITFDVVPFDRYNTALTTQLAGSNPPDLAWILERDAPDFVQSGALANLSTVLTNPQELTPASTALWQKDGQLFAYPFSTSPFGMFYNKELFAQAGITETPEQAQAAGRWTWDTAMSMAAQVAAKVPGKSGLVIRDFEYKMWITLASVWRGFGADAWPQDGKACGFTSPEMVTAMTFLHKAIFTDKALPGPGTTADFFAGQAGMTVAQISRAGLLKEKPFQWGIAPLPAGPKADAQVIGQAGIGVPVKGKQKEVAADFLAFFTNPANTAKLGQFFPPARESLINAQSLAKVSPLFSAEQLQSVVVNGIKTGTVLPAHTGSAKINSLVQSALDPLWKPDADVAGVLDGVCKAINPVLSQ